MTKGVTGESKRRSNRSTAIEGLREDCDGAKTGADGFDIRFQRNVISVRNISGGFNGVSKVFRSVS